MQLRRIGVLAMAVTMTACGVSTQQEIQMGQDEVAQINQQLPIIQDPEINRYLNVLGDSIARLTSRPDLPWQFFMVNSNDVNAFAVPGGYIYVNRGLVERTTRMDELAGVLGHEIGHVVLRHTVKQMGQMQGLQIGAVAACVLTNICNSQAGQEAINVAGTAVVAKFSRDDEKQADDIAIPNVVRAGISPEGIPAMFQILLDEQQTQPSAVENWFADHPTDEARIADTQARINQIDPAILRTLATDSPNYHTFKARVHALPPAPPSRSQ